MNGKLKIFLIFVSHVFFCFLFGISFFSSALAATYSEVGQYIESHPAPENCINWIESIGADGTSYAVKQRCTNWPRHAIRFAFDGEEKELLPEIENPIYIGHCPDGGSYTRQWYDLRQEFARIYLCDGSSYDTAPTTLNPPLSRQSDPCQISYAITYYPEDVDYKTSDQCQNGIVLTEFHSVDLCYDEVENVYKGCGQNCVNPNNKAGVYEIFGNGIDDNCDGRIDNGLDTTEQEICDGIDNNNNGEIDETCIGSDDEGEDKENRETISQCVPSTNQYVGSTGKISSGNLSHSQFLHKPDVPIYYNSLSTKSGPLGKGWTHANDIKVNEIDADSLALTKGNGNTVYFWRSDQRYYPAISVPDYSYIEKVGAGFKRTMKNGIVQNFNSAGSLASITDRNGNATTLAYTNGNLTSITDVNGRVTHLGYDSNNRIVQFTSIDSLTTTLSYNSQNYLESITDAGGNSWNYTYDAYGKMLTKRDPAGNTTTYEYSTQGKLSSSTDSQGGAKPFTYSESQPVTTVTEKDGGVWTFKYDPVMDVVVEMTDPLGNVTQYSYDDYRHLTSINKPFVSSSSYSYDGYGNLLSKTDEIGQTTTYNYNNFGQVTSETGPAGTKVYTYDANGNLVSLNDNGIVLQFQYDSSGNIIAAIDPLGNTTAFEYDAQNNLISMTDPLNATTLFTYDSAGRKLTDTDPSGATTSYSYDNLGRLAGVTRPGNAATYFTYDSSGNIASVTDANGRTTSYAYNSKNLVSSEINAMGQATTFSYATAGCPTCTKELNKLTSLLDARNNVTNYTYDKLGRVLTEADPLGNTHSYSYNAAGNLSARTDAKGERTTYTYDGLKRLTKTTYPDGGTVTYGYNAKNLVTSAANADIAYAYIYDSNGRLESVLDSNGRTISYSYDAAGNRTQMITPDGRTIQYAYDANNRIAQITQAGQAFTFGYNSVSRRSSLTYPNGIAAAYTYDNRSGLTGLVYTDSSSTVVDIFTYTLDNIGSRLTKTDREYQYVYTYDPVYRLTQSQPTQVAQTPLFQQSSESFSYDSVGNRLDGPAKEESSPYTKNHVYDFDNRLVSVSRQVPGNPNPDVITFKYDPFGRRIEKNVSTYEGSLATTYNYVYVYDNEDIILEVLTRTQDGNSTTTTTAYIHGPGIDEPLSMERDGQMYYLHADGLGSITSITDGNGAVVNRYAYDSFGTRKASEAIRIAYAFTGREWDSEIGLYYYRARYYDPEAGRFIGKDPIGFAGGDVNLYAYVENNSVNWRDASGLSPIGASINAIKKALKKVHNELGGPLSKSEPGKYGSPQRGNKEKGYRLDPPHPNRPANHPESHPHINWWDYSEGKRKSGGRKGVEPIIGGILGLFFELINPLDLIAGELADDEEELLRRYYETCR